MASRRALVSNHGFGRHGHCSSRDRCQHEERRLSQHARHLYYSAFSVHVHGERRSPARIQVRLQQHTPNQYARCHAVEVLSLTLCSSSSVASKEGARYCFHTSLLLPSASLSAWVCLPLRARHQATSAVAPGLWQQILKAPFSSSLPSSSLPSTSTSTSAPHPHLASITTPGNHLIHTQPTQPPNQTITMHHFLGLAALAAMAQAACPTMALW